MSKNVAESVRERLYRRDPVFSFEFFPPKDDKGRETLERSLAELAKLNPAFVSVTCGAAGSTRDLTRDLVLSMQERHDFGVMAHITAMGYSRSELADLVADYARRGVRNFLALRGDPPRDVPGWRAPEDQPGNAREVVEIIRRVAPSGVSVGVAGYPEKHPAAPSLEEDLRRLAEKVAAGADFVVTQLFFDNESYFAFVAAARRRGVKVPILPGIMPVTRSGQLERFRELCNVGTDGVAPLFAKEEDIKTHSVGVSYAAAQCADLLRRGAPGVHLYTLNQSRASHTLYTILRSLGWEG